MTDEETKTENPEERGPLQGRALAKAIDEGSRFSIQRDADDDRWDIVTLRVPNARIKYGRDAKVAPERDLSGKLALYNQMRYCVANTESIVRTQMEGQVDPDVGRVFSDLMRVVLHDLRVKEVELDAPAPTDINAALAKAAEEAQRTGEEPKPGKIILLR